MAICDQVTTYYFWVVHDVTFMYKNGFQLLCMHMQPGLQKPQFLQARSNIHNVDLSDPQNLHIKCTHTSHSYVNMNIISYVRMCK